MTDAPTITATVAAHVARLEFDSLPAAVVAKAKEVVLDTLGCQLACSTLVHGQMAIDYAQRSAGPAHATVIGSSLKTSAEHAALVNGILGHGHEIDAILELFGHASAVLVPTVLAVAERQRASGRDLITALVAGYDVAGRIAKAGFSLEVLAPRNFQQGSTGGSIAAAAAAGRLLELDQRQLQAAFGVAGEQACGLQVMRTETGHMNKSLHMGVGSRNGVASAYLAEVGYGGALDVLDPPWSVFEAFVKGEEHPEEMTRELGQRYEIEAETFKRYASGRPTHTAIATMHRIMAEQQLSATDIERIEVRIPTLEQRLLSHSLTRNIDFEYNIAVAAIDGQIAWEQYTEERQADPVLIAFRERVTSVGDPEFDAIKRANLGANPSQVTIDTSDGRTFTDRMVFPPGHPRNPLAPGELEAKFMYWSTQVIPESQAVDLREAIEHLEDVEDVNLIGDLLRI
jgi:2-methylcitrate dehydratase PrpD